MPLSNTIEVELFNVWAMDFMGTFPKSFGNEYLLLVTMCQNRWRPVLGTPRAIISDEGTHVINKNMSSLQAKYDIRHKAAYTLKLMA